MKNKNVQMTGVAVANGNGNGNGQKVKETKPTDNVKVVSWEEFDHKNAIKITPYIDCLTKKGIEMYTNMGSLENAKLFIDDLAMSFGGGTNELTGILMLLDAIRRKINEEDKLDYPEDFISFLQDHLFFHLNEADRATDVYIEAIRSGNFVLGEMPEIDYEVSAVDMRPPKHKFKERDNALRTEIAALAETVKKLQEQIEGKTKARPTSSSINFEAVQTANVEELGLILSALKDNENLPVKMSDAIYDFITLSADPNKLEDADYDPQFVAECIRRQSQRDSKKNSDSSQIEPADFEGMYLSEFWHSDGESPNRSLLLEVQQFPGEPSPRIVTSVYRKRTDNRFVLVINYLPDSKEEYPYQSEEPCEDESINDYARHHLNILAEQICHILKSDKVSDDYKDSFVTIIFEAGNEVGIAVTDPDLIKVALPKIIDSHDLEYGKAIVHSLQALLYRMKGEVVVEIDRYNYRFGDPKPDALETDLASHLSAILNNSETPESLYDAISGELSALFDGKELTKVVDSPEFIRKALKTKETALAA